MLFTGQHGPECKFLNVYLSFSFFSLCSYINGLIDAIVLCITLIVVAIPEGLPLAVTIALAYSMKVKRVLPFQLKNLCHPTPSFTSRSFSLFPSRQ